MGEENTQGLVGETLVMRGRGKRSHAFRILNYRFARSM